MVKPLTALRFPFALMVFIHHLYFFSASDNLFQSIHNYLGNEGYRITFFFILSGFILSLNYKQKIIAGKISNRDFWISRLSRIYPLHFITFLIAIPISLHHFATDTFPWLTVFFCNLLALQSFIPDPKYYYSFNGVSWAISCELFFYFIFPFIIMLLHRYKKVVFFWWIPILFIPISTYFVPKHFQEAFFYIHPLFRVVDFFIGILLYRLIEAKYFDKIFASHINATLLEICTLFIFLLFFLLHEKIVLVYRYSCYYWFPTILMIMVFSYQKGYLFRLLSEGLFYYLGKLSFAFYFIHQLIIRYVVVLNTKYSLIHNNYLFAAIIFAIALTASYFVFRYIENPCTLYIRNKYKSNQMYSYE